MATTWTNRTIPTTTWTQGRMGGAYLTNSIGEYILTANSERIIVLIPGGNLSITSWTTRPVI